MTVIAIVDDIAGTGQGADVIDQRHGTVKVHVIHLHLVLLAIIDDTAVIGDDIITDKPIYRDLPGKGFHAAAGHRHKQIARGTPALKGRQVFRSHFFLGPQRPIVITCQYFHYRFLHFRSSLFYHSGHAESSLFCIPQKV